MATSGSGSSIRRGLGASRALVFLQRRGAGYPPAFRPLSSLQVHPFRGSSPCFSSVVRSCASGRVGCRGAAARRFCFRSSGSRRWSEPWRRGTATAKLEDRAQRRRRCCRSNAGAPTHIDSLIGKSKKSRTQIFRASGRANRWVAEGGAAPLLQPHPRAVFATL